MFFVLAVAGVLASCGNAGTSNEVTTDSTAVTVDSTAVDTIPAPGHADVEEGGMLQGPGATEAVK